MLWEDLTPENYPVYESNSLLNTNEDFDYGEFANLPNLLEENPEKYSSFVYTFDTDGIYVFSDSRVPEKQMIVAIMSDDRTCPDDVAF